VFVAGICITLNYLLRQAQGKDDNYGHGTNTKATVEFALHPQHEASCDSEIQTKKALKRKFRKQLGRLSIISLNSKDKEEAFESQG